MQIKFEKVSYSPSRINIDGVCAVDDVSFQLEQPGITGIMGASDSGKSTLLFLLAGLLHPDRGSVFTGEQDTKGKNGKHSRKKSACAFLMPGAERLLWEKSLEREFNAVFRGSGLDAEERNSRMADVLECVGLDAKALADIAPARLSRQERYKLALALVMAGNADILLLEEPFSQLDASGRQALVGLFEKLKSEGRHIIISSNDADSMAELADTVLVMQRGRLLRSGNPRTVFADYYDLIRNSIPVPSVKMAAQKLRERDVNMPSNVVEYEQFIDRLKIIMWRKQK